MNRPATSEASIEPELLGPLPRPVQCSEHDGCLRVFLVPFILVGLGTLCAALFSLVVVLFGHVVPGKVHNRNMSYGEDGTSYHLHYSYSLNGRTYKAIANVPISTYRKFHVGDRVPVKALPMVPHAGAQLQVEGEIMSWFWWVFTLFWNAILGNLVWMGYVQPWQRRSLVAYGCAVPGRVVDKQTGEDGEGGHVFKLHYEYVPALAPKEGGTALQTAPILRHITAVSEEQWNQVQRGDRLTVLHAPSRPQKSCLYRFSPCQVNSHSA